MAENRNGLDVLAQLAGRLPRAPVARLPTIANSLSIIGTLEQNRLEEHSKNPQGYSDQSLVVHGPAALLLWFSARDHQGGLDSPQLSLYRALYLTADTLDALNQVYLTVPAGAPSGTGRSQWRAIDPRGDDTRRLYSQETVRPGGLPFASFVKYQDAHDFTHNRGQHNFLTGAVTFHSSGSSVKLLYAAPHVQLYDLLARWVHEDGLSSQDAAIHDSQHLVLLSIAMLMQQEGNDATQNSYEPLETRLHVALLGESPASRGTILNTLRNISLHALALCQVWDPAEPYATPWVRDHIQWCKSLRTTSHVAYPNLENPHFYRTHLERAVGVCQRVVVSLSLALSLPFLVHASSLGLET
ncbi:hypothetical protein Rt10032_c06g2915 [Rhodotorula toruloides]|uniref:Uncharacterized protein n=1 Tax=Rhodotorula toruloides TaxID=5286 RepID=A0A511KEV3_RHOTO|nr:hypothetical protein Rt10032_c06g2915 [Rhodotorula toruloides]